MKQRILIAFAFFLLFSSCKVLDYTTESDPIKQENFKKTDDVSDYKLEKVHNLEYNFFSKNREIYSSKKISRTNHYIHKPVNAIGAFTIMTPLSYLGFSQGMESEAALGRAAALGTFLAILTWIAMASMKKEGSRVGNIYSRTGKIKRYEIIRKL